MKVLPTVLCFVAQDVFVSVMKMTEVTTTISVLGIAAVVNSVCVICRRKAGEVIDGDRLVAV